ncbi:unnamed protein product [Spirodela intermedia]|uniref:Uncharacterized protein n=1 Tax=Spirodela intermedia TaxID=51605 RepID=A0A7I8IPN4_SPIIN|nr:unnamed protein product [Spirodela intermedia]CAA6659102.1 unnamed protein product [Spirodela intermedia]
MGRRRFRCCGSIGRNRREEETPRLLKTAVSGVTELLRLFQAPPRQQRGDNWGREGKPLVRDVEDVVSILRSDYDQAYFLTDLCRNCLFEDPTIKFYGRPSICQYHYFHWFNDLSKNTEIIMWTSYYPFSNLDLLVPFFERPSLILENIEKVEDGERKFILAAWKLRTFLRLPWRPLISIGGTTTYDLDNDFKIVRHAERWDVSALQAVGQIFLPSSIVNDQ